MPAYMIVTAVIHDREQFINGYGAAAADLIGRFGGEYRLRAPGAECLEGGFGKEASMVISKWPDRAAAKAFCVRLLSYLHSMLLQPLIA